MAATAAALTVFVGCQRVEQDAPLPEETAPEAEESSAIIPGELIVELSEEMTEAIASLSPEEAGAKLGVISAERMYADAGEWEPRHREAGLHRWYVLTYDPASMTSTKAAEETLLIPGVVYTEPVRKIKPTAIFNDPDLGKQWHYYNDGTLTSSHKAGCDINVLPVWENFTTGDSKVIVSVVDGGIDMSHYDLAAVTIPGGPNGSRNFVTGGYTITAHGHGTHVAGTIGAINNNGRGGCGIAGGSDGKGGVMLMSCQVFAVNPDDPTKDLSSRDFGEAMVWGADHGAVISQNSWGNVYETKEDAARGGVGAMKSPIDYFIKNAGCDANGNQRADSPMKGGVVIFAAGNEGWPDGWPAEYEPVIAVGATGPSFYRAPYSNYGPWVDICAPGGDASYNQGQVYSCLPGDKYGWYQGTSMACPHVSGVAALLVSYFGGPGFTNAMLTERLLGGANPNAISANAQIGPMLDAYGAFTYGSTTPPEAVSSYTVTPRSNFLDFSWKVTKDSDDKKAYGYLLLASKNQADLTSLDPKNIPSTVSKALVEVGSLGVGAGITGTIPDLDFNTKYYTAIVGYDYSKNYSSLSPVKDVTTLGNAAPVITTAYTGDYKVKAHEVLRVVYSISDPDGHTFTVNLTPGSEAAALEQLPDGTWRISFTGNVVDPGTYHAVLSATDKFGAVTELPIDYVILENQAPEIRKPVENMVYEQMGERLSINMDEYLYDPDGEQLSYTIDNTPPGVVHLNQVGNVMNLTTMDFGMADITITGKDAKGLTVVLTFKVLVRDPKAEPDVYPTMVEDILYISDGTEKTLDVVLTNAGGAVLVKQTFTADAFAPAEIDMSGYAPGRYGVKVTSDGITIKRTVVKL